MSKTRTMRPIPWSAGENIAKGYGYDQVIIIARRVGDEPQPHGEHVTTYGIDEAHCAAAASTGNFLKHRVMGWPRDEAPNPAAAAIAYALELEDDDDAMIFLRLWNEGSFDQLRDEYDAIPEAVFIGAEVGYVAST